MSQATYKTAIEFVLKWEVGSHRMADGGYTNRSDDPGGETKWGISKRAYPNVNIRDLTLEQALDIYRRDYWDVFARRNPPIDLDTINPALAVCVFDSGVNCGVGRAYKWLRQAEKEKDPIAALLGLRLEHYNNLKPKMAWAYNGWINRLNDLKKLAQIIEAEVS